MSGGGSMQSCRARWTRMCLEVVCLAVISFIAPTALFAQGASGRIVGRVADPSGAVLAHAKVTLTNDATAISRTALTSDSGDYAFVDVVPGTYTLQFELTGFKKNVQKSVTLDVNQVVTLNSTLQVGASQETVEVTSEAPQVDTTSTQLGAVINDRSVNELPLNSRDTYQFLQLQPGVQAQLGNGNGSLFYGSQDTGSVSVNGGRTRANNFSVNGGDANDQFVNLPTVQPTPDSVEEFRVITNTFDAEYGRNSGSVVNVITKSGSNSLHGDIYEYFRNTVLDAKNYFDVAGRPQWNQNQFGGTLGGPIKKDRTFFFVSYEGRRVREGITGEQVNIPTTAERGGNFSAQGPFSGGISDAFVAQALDGRPGCDAALGLPSGGIAALPIDPASGVVDWSTVFPAGVIPTACQDPVASNLMANYIPTSSVAVPVSTDNEDQFTVRFDHKINDHQNFSAYYYFNDIRAFQPFNEFEQAGANVPGFGNLNNNRFQQWNLTHTWTISNALVNEAHFTYMREGQLGFLKPQTTNALTASCTGSASAFCFTGVSDSSSGPNSIQGQYGTNPKYGITPGLPSTITGVPFVNIGGGAEFGNNFEGFLPQVGNSFQWSDELTWVKGTHTFKFGVDVRRQRFDQYYYFDVNGEFQFDNSGPNAILPADGNNYAEFLLGLSDTYTQGSGQREDVRGTSVYPFAQDSWKIKPNLTLNYGLRWELDTPPTDISGHVETFRPGQNSSVYPCALSPLSQSYFGVSSSSCAAVGVQPTGLVVPGDPGVPAGLTSTYYHAFAPRIGIAWSPGNSGKTSIRAGWGLFYNPIEQLVLAQFGAEPPFGGSTVLSETQFNLPFAGQDYNPATQTGTTYLNPFNGVLQAPRGSPQDWARFEPIILYGDFQPHLRTQYSAQYNLTIQRELTKDMKLEVGYVGSQGHRLLATHDVNYSNPQTCLDINTLDGPGTCAQFTEDAPFSVTVPSGFNFHMPNGTVVPGTGQTLQFVGLRKYSSPQCDPTTGNGCPLASGVPVFTSIFAQDTIASSAYNSLQVSLDKRFSHGLQFTAAYTYSKSIDEASSFEGILNPLPGAHNYAPSLFDARHRFVVSYFWNLPIKKYNGLAGKVLNDWAVSGITTYQTGFPIRITSSADNELMNSFDFELPGEPDQLSKFGWQSPQKNGNYYFNPQIFTENTTDPTCGGAPYPGCYDPSLLGRVGNAPRTICCGPGISDTDFVVMKSLKVNERTHFEFRAEIFNIFNHTQFFNPDGNSTDGSQFGQVTEVKDPRLVQFALKFYF